MIRGKCCNIICNKFWAFYNLTTNFFIVILKEVKSVSLRFSIAKFFPWKIFLMWLFICLSVICYQYFYWFLLVLIEIYSAIKYQIFGPRLWMQEPHNSWLFDSLKMILWIHHLTAVLGCAVLHSCISGTDLKSVFLSLCFEAHMFLFFR